MELTKEEWVLVKSWLNNYRVCCNKEKQYTKHEKISQFYNDISIQVREFINKKDKEV